MTRGIQTVRSVGRSGSARDWDTVNELARRANETAQVGFRGNTFTSPFGEDSLIDRASLVLVQIDSISTTDPQYALASVFDVLLDGTAESASSDQIAVWLPSGNFVVNDFCHAMLFEESFNYPDTDTSYELYVVLITNEEVDEAFATVTLPRWTYQGEEVSDIDPGAGNFTIDSFDINGMAFRFSNTPDVDSIQNVFRIFENLSVGDRFAMADVRTPSTFNYFDIDAIDTDPDFPLPSFWTKIDVTPTTSSTMPASGRLVEFNFGLTSGSGGGGGITRKTSVVTGGVILDPVTYDTVICDPNASSFTVTLPATPSDGELYRILRNEDTTLNQVTISAGLNLINLSPGLQVGSLKLLVASEGVTLQYSLSAGVWIIVDDNRFPLCLLAEVRVAQLYPTVTLTKFNWDTLVYNVGGMMDLTTDTVTIGRDGRYTFEVGLEVTNLPDTAFSDLELFKNGALFRRDVVYSPVATAFPTNQGVWTFDCLAGDTIEAFLYHNAGFTWGSSTSNARYPVLTVLENIK